ncbi:hypothetical protein BDZ94DRAFT_1281595 [Collybia nuda]|uniref:LysM domain-containing protein n=1 Tax=Collybia nuda TaxID=64659 RepID=A0A9P5Y8D7_9AGAR|nr:hypothetical protein BDZ94DRAFT_1281595 [Collybia nuda]
MLRCSVTVFSLLLWLSFPVVSVSSSFHQKIDLHNSAHSKAFHSNLLKQLAASKNRNKSIQPEFVTSNPPASLAPPSLNTFADEPSSTFQTYINGTLPDTPPPSANCATALTAVIQCNSTIPLMRLFTFNPNFDLPNVASACAGYIIHSNNVTYPPTFIADTISGPYMAQCLQDPTTAQFCSPLVTSFNSTGGLLALPPSELCTFCTLETLNVTLSNPATYSIPLAGLLSSAVQMCGPNFTKYNVTSPPKLQVTPGSNTHFGSNITTTSTTDCLLFGRNVTTSTASNCAAVAEQFSVSYYDILGANPFLNSDCLILANSKLCVPQACTTYRIAPNDTCTTVALSAGRTTGVNITTTQLLSFNPELGTFCQLMPLKIGQAICPTPNGGFPKKAPVPTPTPSGTTSNCGKYYLVKEGDICNTVVLSNTVSFPDFLTLNPEIDANCTNLWLGYNYCVAPFPPLVPPTIPVATTNYSSATIMVIPLSTASYTPTLTTFDIPTAGIPAPTNIANGTRAVACGYYYDVVAGDTLAGIAATVGVDSGDLLNWNPELANGLPPQGSAICVLFPTGNYTLPDATPPPNIALNTTTSCAQFYTVQSGDGCPSIEAKFGIPATLFQSMNPSINSQCTNIIIGVAYCVFPDTPIDPPDSSALGEAYCVKSSNGTTTIPPNVAPGTITTGCTEYYTVVSGDTCSAIDTEFGLTLVQFIAMNPEISSTCNNLALGEAYCVKSSNSTTSVGPSAPSNLATGSLANCNTYHTVVSGDNCGAIETRYGIAAVDFFRWNPERIVLEVEDWHVKRFTQSRAVIRVRRSSLPKASLKPNLVP